MNPLHLVCGPPGSGKSTYGAALAASLGAAFFDSDTATERLVRAAMAGLGLSPDDRDSPAYKTHFRAAVYATLFDLAKANLAHLPVVVAGPFTRESADPHWPARLTAEFATRVKIHFLHASPELRRTRLIARSEPRDLAKLSNWETYLVTCREDPPPFPHVWVEQA